MARRLGIQYVIWNHKIWGAYSASAGWRKYTGADPHTDHVHISFTWAGARSKTSFWTGKVGNVGAAPTPTLPTDPTHAARRPRHARRRTIAPPRPQPVARGRPCRRARARRRDPDPAGTERRRADHRRPDCRPAYLIEASGTYSWGSAASQVGRRRVLHGPRTTATWRRDRSVHPWQPDRATTSTSTSTAPTCSGDPDIDTGERLRHAAPTPTAGPTRRSRTGRVTFALWDPTTLADNSGALTDPGHRARRRGTR